MQTAPNVAVAAPPPASLLPTAAAYPAPPAVGPPAAAPLAVVRAFLAGRPAVEALAPVAVLEASGVPGELRGTAAIAGYWSAVVGAVGERELTVETAVEAGDRAVVILRLRGIHAGRLLGKAPNGRRLDLPLMVVARVDAGLIRHLRLWFDRLTLLEQIGGARSDR